jgi:hypothetical protein
VSISIKKLLKVEESDIKILRRSNYFDEEYYYFQREDVKLAKVDAIEHYLKAGWQEGVNPSIEFNNNAYLDAYPEVRMNPLLHYLLYGKQEGKKRFLVNDRNYYDLKIIKESGYFDEEYYYFQREDVKLAKVDAIEHYLKAGWQEGTNPSLKFDNNAYLEAYPEVDMNPLLHYLLYGKQKWDFKKKDIILENKKNILSIHKKYKLIEKELKAKVMQGHKIRIAFFVVSASIFQGKSLFEAMIENGLFDPFIVLIKDISWGEEVARLRMEREYKSLSSKYKNVYQCYDNGTFVDFSKSIDMACIANPYDVVHKYYTPKYLKDAGVLSFCINYGYMGLYNYTKMFVRGVSSYNYMWKIFLENKYLLRFIQKKRCFKINNLSISGYSKMDSLCMVSKRELKRKKIIIASHHSITYNKYYLNISQFLTYSYFILELPKLYPDVDFVFRPHPHLFIRLTLLDIWNKERINSYLKDIEAIPNMVYDNSGDYFDLFVNSDALIHDCGSFLAEYLYTDHPQCYLLKDEREINDQFLHFGKKILNHVYKAFSKEQIIDFIDNVVIKEQDYMKRSREKFANKYIKINYPHATEKIIEYIKKKIT